MIGFGVGESRPDRGEAMDFPSTLKIGPFQYGVVFEHEPKSDHGKALWGQCRYERHQIAIESEAPDDRKIETLMHESLHAIAFEAAAVRLREREVKSLSLALMNFLIENPTFTRLFIKDDADGK